MTFLAANLLGAAAFLWPFLVAVRPAAEGRAHAADAPVVVALCVPLLVATAAAEARRRRGDARLVALLGALSAVGAALRIPKGPSGEGFVFVLPILAGWSMGGVFAFLLGAFSVLVSALLGGGIGPWLPFQMFGVGWVGLGAAGLRGVLRGRFEVPALAAYAAASAFAYGFLINLWFWPFLDAGSYRPGLGAAETLRRYWQFYVLTSLPWDAGRALFSNVPLVAVLAVPVGRLLRRTRDRFGFQDGQDLSPVAGQFGGADAGQGGQLLQRAGTGLADSQQGGVVEDAVGRDAGRPGHAGPPGPQPADQLPAAGDHLPAAADHLPVAGDHLPAGGQG